MKDVFKKTDKITLLITTFLGSGMLPKMPGTYGSLAAAIVAYPIALVSFTGCFALASAIVFFGAIPFVAKAMKDTATEDPGWIVIDEVVGMWMALAFIDPTYIVDKPWLLLFGFALFRFFDILKPLGIHQLEKLPGAWGVMADDLLGGIYSGIIMLTLVSTIF
ncbi:MAG: phosphatidylglycerophosphatase A [Fibrobacteraceae bacterium]|nr:phosphatidylglycerophosphatase A [Fibrobacteraceae bacterium]